MQCVITGCKTLKNCVWNFFLYVKEQKCWKYWNLWGYIQYLSHTENSYEWKLEQVLSSILVFFLEFLVARTFLFFSHWPSYSNWWTRTSDISVSVVQTEEVVNQGSIDREEGQGSGGGSTEEGEATRRPTAGGHTQAQQGTDWQWSTQTQGMPDSCIIVMTCTVQLLKCCDITVAHAVSGARSQCSLWNVSLLK